MPFNQYTLYTTSVRRRHISHGKLWTGLDTEREMRMHQMGREEHPRSWEIRVLIRADDGRRLLGERSRLGGGRVTFYFQGLVEDHNTSNHRDGSGGMSRRTTDVTAAGHVQSRSGSLKGTGGSGGWNSGLVLRSPAPEAGNDRPQSPAQDNVNYQNSSVNQEERESGLTTVIQHSKLKDKLGQAS